MADLQVPPAVGTSGQRLDVAVVNAASTIWRQSIVIGDPASSGNMATVDSAGNVHTVSASSGMIQVLTSGTYLVTGTMSLSSGTVTLSSAPLVIVATSGGQLTVTASGVVSLSSGTVTLSSAPLVVVATSGGQLTVTASGVVSLSSGTVTLSSAPLVIVATSGGQLTVTASGVVSLSSGTVTLSSNPTVISASSGTVGVTNSTGQTLSVFMFNASSSASVQGVAAGAHTIYGWAFGNNNAGSLPVTVHVYNTTAPTVGSTTNRLFSIRIPWSTGAAGNNYTLPLPGVNSTGGIGFVLVDSFNSTSTAFGHNAGDVSGELYYI